MDLDVATALDRDLDERRSALGGRCQPREIVDQEVAQAVDLRHLCRVDSQRSAKDRLELLAVDLFGLREKLEDPAAVVVDHHDPDRRGESRSAASPFMSW